MQHGKKPTNGYESGDKPKVFTGKNAKLLINGEVVAYENVEYKDHANVQTVEIHRTIQFEKPIEWIEVNIDVSLEKHKPYPADGKPEVTK